MRLKLLQLRKISLLRGIGILFLVSCSNMLEDTANKDMKPAVFYNAQRKIDKHDYTGAIADFESLGTDFLAQRDVAVILRFGLFRALWFGFLFVL